MITTIVITIIFLVIIAFIILLIIYFDISDIHLSGQKEKSTGGISHLRPDKRSSDGKPDQVREVLPVLVDSTRSSVGDDVDESFINLEFLSGHINTDNVKMHANFSDDADHGQRDSRSTGSECDLGQNHHDGPSSFDSGDCGSGRFD